jgi:hydroxymethylbilane synthase
LSFAPLRGNVDTRIRKLREGDMSAIVLAAAGIKRLGLGNVITEYIDYDIILPAPGQGALALEIREDDLRTWEICSRLDYAPTRASVMAERSFLRSLGGGCQVPVGALGQVADSNRLRLLGVVLSPDGASGIRDELTGSMDEAEAVGVRLAEKLIAQGAGEILGR